MRLAIDTGGTFTDLVVESDDGSHTSYKAATVPEDPISGILDVIDVAAAEMGTTRGGLLGGTDTLIHGTTQSLNAVLTQTTARTAFLTTAGHPDVLVLREGGRTNIFDLARPYPEPYVPRALTFEVPERIAENGEVVAELDESRVVEIIELLGEHEVEAVGVCLLWSIVNPAHELRVGELLAEHRPDLPVTLSHELNPCLREYRRASSTCIDASLKPVMASYIGNLNARLAEAGFTGRLLLVTAAGGALDAEDVAAAPIHSLNSGPAMAPVAGRFFGEADTDLTTAIVADTGGTTYDVSVVRKGQILWTRETWVGEPFFGHMTGFPSVDVRSVGAGGGSIAWVDEAGLLRLGPESAGADPGPACYGRGGQRPTVTDAAVVLGYIDPHYFLGGRATLDADLAVQAVRTEVAGPLGLEVEAAAAAILRYATERMVSAIDQITIHEGIDPRETVLVGGGGAAGLNVLAIARRLRCPEVIVPSVGPVLSAAGALISDLVQSFEVSLFTTNRTFAFDEVNAALATLHSRCQAFVDGPGSGAISSDITFSVEARYPHQVWELDVPLRSSRVESPAQLERLTEDFHLKHREVFAVADDSSDVEFASWHARARCRLRAPIAARAAARSATREPEQRRVYFPDHGYVHADVWHVDEMPIEQGLLGPAVVQTNATTIVVEPGSAFRLMSSGTLKLFPDGDGTEAAELTAGSRSTGS
jgi:N-methylhydantoinase A